MKQDYEKARTIPKITDTVGHSAFTAVCNRTDKSLNDDFDDANAKRLSNLKMQHEAAYIYLALAFRVMNDRSLTIQSQGKAIGHEMLFHFAGHAFREIGQINRAADAYWRAGVSCEKLNDLAIRSLTRAKMCYQEVGETEAADRMHVLEWKSRQSRAGGLRKWPLALWGITSDFGTNSHRWALSVVICIALSTIVYELLYLQQSVYVSPDIEWTPIVSSLYFSVVTMTTLGYGEILPRTLIAQLFVIFNVFNGHLLLAVGATVLGKKVIGR